MAVVTSDGGLQERALVDAIANPRATKDEVAALIDALPSGPFQAQRWAELAADGSLEGWRRLAAYQVLVSRCIPFPTPKEDAVRLALEPLGVGSDQLFDDTIAQHVPVERTSMNKLFTARIPIDTQIGPAIVYLVASSDGRIVERAAVYPTVGGP